MWESLLEADIMGRGEVRREMMRVTRMMNGFYGGDASDSLLLLLLLHVKIFLSLLATSEGIAV